jgi:signal transduction histidine kinase
LEWGISVPVVAALCAAVIFQRAVLEPRLPQLALWLAVVFVADLLPVTLWEDIVLSMSLPVLLAAGMLLSPIEAALVAFIGAADIREFRRETTLGRAIYNRSQVALSVFLSSVVFHSLHGSIERWPHVVPVAILALVVDLVTNALLVAEGVALKTDVPWWSVVRNVYAGSPRLASGYLCLGLVALLLATAFAHVGEWALVAFLIPVALARQMFSNGTQLQEAAVDLAAKREALDAVPGRIEAERKDERVTLAGALHDEVLQPLYKVHLMAQVLRQDLAGGRLLDLDQDLPDLLRATDAASSSIRSLIRTLQTKQSPANDLQATLHMLLEELRRDTPAVLEEVLDSVDAAPELRLITYQIAREAVCNAIRHASASTISLKVENGGSEVRVEVSDNGCGFDPGGVDRSEHFGLQLMRQRAEAVGGVLHISTGAHGTRVVAKLPVE